MLCKCFGKGSWLSMMKVWMMCLLILKCFFFDSVLWVIVRLYSLFLLQSSLGIGMWNFYLLLGGMWFCGCCLKWCFGWLVSSGLVVGSGVGVVCVLCFSFLCEMLMWLFSVCCQVWVVMFVRWLRFFGVMNLLFLLYLVMKVKLLFSCVILVVRWVCVLFFGRLLVIVLRQVILVLCLSILKCICIL